MQRRSRGKFCNLQLRLHSMIIQCFKHAWLAECTGERASISWLLGICCQQAGVMTSLSHYGNIVEVDTEYSN